MTSGWKQPLRLHRSGRYGKVFLGQTCALWKRLRVATPPRKCCPIQLTDFPVVLIKAIRRHRAVWRAPHPYWFDSVTDLSRFVLHCTLCLIGYRVGLRSQRSLVGTVGYLLWYLSQKQHGLMAYVYVHQKNSESNIKGAKNEFESEYFNRSSNIRTLFYIPSLRNNQQTVFVHVHNLSHTLCLQSFLCLY